MAKTPTKQVGISHIFAAVRRYFKIPLSRYKANAKPRAVLVGFAPWKDFMDKWIPGRPLVLHDKLTKADFYLKVAPKILQRRGTEVYVWSYKDPPFLQRFCERYQIPFYRVEDGFLRSIALGASRCPPLSLCFDSAGLYFDAMATSRLEQIIATHDFANDHELMERARHGIERLLQTKLSKYNCSVDADMDAIYGPKDRKRVLVVGQVEGDMSIVKGRSRVRTNNELVWFAALENPDAQIIYKPHPEVLSGFRPGQSDPADVRGIAMVLEQNITLADAFRSVDHVYTMTSLAGFEALIRGIKVTCLGVPFYAGWGATDDRQSCPRRRAKRTAEEIFAAAYILYPRYLNPFFGEPLEFEGALGLLELMKQAVTSRAASTVAPLAVAAATGDTPPMAVADRTTEQILNLPPNLNNGRLSAGHRQAEGVGVLRQVTR